MADANGIPELWQFRFSMYPEKARWALDYKGIPHRRHSLLPGPHVLKLLPRFGQKAMPILRDGPALVKSSAAVVAHLEQRRPLPALYPAEPALRARALELQAWFDEVGEQVRRAFFLEFLQDGEYAARQFASGQSETLQRRYRRLFPIVRLIMRADMKISARRAGESRQRTQDALDQVVNLRRPGGYLVGDHFSIADLTAAVVLQACANPPEYPCPCEPPYPSALQDWYRRWQNHPGAAWVREIYRRHRGVSAALEDHNG